MTALTEPGSYLQTVRGDIYGETWWLGRDFQYKHDIYDAAFEQVLGTQHVEEIVRFFGERPSVLYAEVAKREQKTDARYFVEKQLPVSRGPELMAELYEGSREIFLVRDPRDLLASVLAYNRKRGFHSFGREQVDTDEEFIRGPLSRDVTELLKAWTRREDSAHLVRYEDLIRSPEESLAAMCRYLAIDASTARDIVDDAVSAQSEGARADHPTAPTPQASIGRWKTDLPRDLRAVAEEALEPFLSPF